MLDPDIVDRFAAGAHSLFLNNPIERRIKRRVSERDTGGWVKDFSPSPFIL